MFLYFFEGIQFLAFLANRYKSLEKGNNFKFNLILKFQNRQNY